jgi:hypothetical protein
MERAESAWPVFAAVDGSAQDVLFPVTAKMKVGRGRVPVGGTDLESQKRAVSPKVPAIEKVLPFPQPVGVS